MVVPIGSPDEAIVSSLNLEVTTPRDFSALLAPRPLDSNKGMYGHALVVGGSLGKSGAAAMAGMSVLRAGAGLSTVAVPRGEEMRDETQNALPDRLGHPVLILGHPRSPAYA